jgi:hypothetical protein
MKNKQNKILSFGDGLLAQEKKKMNNENIRLWR